MKSDVAAERTTHFNDEWKRKYEASLQNWLSNVTERQREYVASKPLIPIKGSSEKQFDSQPNFDQNEKAD